MNKLFFGMGNAKLSKAIATFSLPAGFTCPFAYKCLSKTNKFTGKLTEGKNTCFRCYSAVEESVFKSVRESRWKNFELLKQTKGIRNKVELIQRSLPLGIGVVRVHASGDYYSEEYFLAWLNVALNNPLTVFYSYTKALPFWVKYKKHIPPNFRLTASVGGTHDYLIKKHKLKYAEVVFSVEEAEQKGLEIDHDDFHAYNSTKSFCVLLHGKQKANSVAGEALKKLKKQGLGFYNESSKNLLSKEIKPVKIYVPFMSVKSSSVKRNWFVNKTNKTNKIYENK